MGKSNVLAALWTLLQRGSPAPAPSDLSFGASAPIHLSAVLSSGEEVALDVDDAGSPTAGAPTVPVLLLPASLRSRTLIATPTEPPALRLARSYFGSGEASSSAAPAAALVAGLERMCEDRETGLVLLIEEPELFLRPQAQRYLYRVLRRFAENGNQVLYSTHEPAFLNVGRLDELALVEHRADSGTVVIQPEALPADESFRAISEFDAERSELFLGRAAVLVEGRTEKLALPFVFRALGYDADREAITIVDCGGKPNIPLFVRICHAARIPCLAIHDRDAEANRHPSHAERVLNSQIKELAGHTRTVELAPDFEAVAGLRGHRHKPARAFEHFSRLSSERVPAVLSQAVQEVVALARG